MNNLNGSYGSYGSGGSRSPQRRGRGGAPIGMDFYRRVPRDLTESTSLGAMMSICAICVMTTLFLSESWAFFNTKTSTTVALLEDSDGTVRSSGRKKSGATSPSLMRINFNITFLDMHCDYVSVDVLDALGTHRQNITKNVEKWQLDSSGVRRVYSGRNREVREVQNEVHKESLEQLHENGVHAIPLSGDNFGPFLEQNPLSFINFFAPWCMWCQRLHPTWEKMAERVQENKLPVGVGTVNCVQEAAICQQQRIAAFPSLRWYREGLPMLPEYKQDRTVDAIFNFVKRKVEQDEKFKNFAQLNEGSEHEIENYRRSMLGTMNQPDHPACQVTGYLLVNRVPGNFHVEARSKNHNLNAAMTNLTHHVHHLSFGDPLFGVTHSILSNDDSDIMNNIHGKALLKSIPPKYRKNYNPVDDRLYLTSHYHRAYHHYIKVVPTHILHASGQKSKTVVSYQFLEQSQMVYYDDLAVPEARFSYDLSPMSVVVSKEGRQWYDYVTSLCAIVGGTFTTLGLIDASLHKVFKGKKLD